MPDLDMFMRWASREMKMFCCWREAATLTASGAGEGEGWDDGLSFAKQIRHFPANRGLWSGSRSRPQSWNKKIDRTGQFAGGEPLQMLERSSSWWTLEWCCSRSRERKLWLQTPQVRLDSPPEVEMIIIFSVKFVWRGRRGWQFSTGDSCGDLILKENEMMTPTLSYHDTTPASLPNTKCTGKTGI